MPGWVGDDAGLGADDVVEEQEVSSTKALSLAMLTIDDSLKREALREIEELLGAERVVQLRCLLVDVMQDTGFGDVKLVVAEGKVALLKAEKSYK